MTDSFFGFDTALPEDGGGGIGGGGPDDSEEEYDALNEETFGQAKEGDWEELHEDLVRLDQREGGDGDSGPDSDLDMNFSSVRIDNLEMNDDNESEARLQLDPSVWTMPSNPETPKPPAIARPPAVVQPKVGLGTNFTGIPPNFPMPNPSQLRICSVEEIEQSMKQQAQQLTLPPPNGPRQDTNVHQPYHPNMTLPRPPPGFGVPALIRQPPLTIPVNFPPPLNIAPPPLHLLQTNVPPPGSGMQPPLFPLNVPPPNYHEQQNHANFNQRLVQEIQQNHPLLSQHRQHHQLHQNQQNRYQHNNRQNHHYQHGSQQLHNRHLNGKVNRSGEYDEYANMMSERDKQWLLGIQLSQLNKDTPYYSDYYFCVFRERKERQKGENERESKAHKDNTFYHPLTQQMLQRNGLIGRERRNSEKSQDIKEVPARNYTPLQFENSLGKLQCGSVTAPRKIIDQDVVAETGTSSGAVINPEVLSQRKSRQILLHVESLYKILLKMEDLNNPMAIEAKRLLKEKRERERQIALERGQQVDEQNNLTANGIDADNEDTFDSLLEKLLAGLTPEGVLLVLSVRKGKLLLKRIQGVLKDHPFRWNLWCTILGSLAMLLKRERDDPEELLTPLFGQLESHVKYSTVNELLPLLDTFLNSDKLLSLIPKCKFLLTTVLTFIDRMEYFYSVDESAGLTTEVTDRWKLFLKELSKAVSSVGVGPQKVLLKLDSDCKIVHNLRIHFQRHSHLDLELKLLALVSIEDKK